MTYPLTEIICLFPSVGGPVAQLVEQLTFNQLATGSNPVGLTIRKACNSNSL